MLVLGYVLWEGDGRWQQHTGIVKCVQLECDGYHINSAEAHELHRTYKYVTAGRTVITGVPVLPCLWY